jgi:hypothetical protein
MVYVVMLSVVMTSGVASILHLDVNKLVRLSLTVVPVQMLLTNKAL